MIKPLHLYTLAALPLALATVAILARGSEPVQEAPAPTPSIPPPAVEGIPQPAPACILDPSRALPGWTWHGYYWGKPTTILLTEETTPAILALGLNDQYEINTVWLCPPSP